MPIPSDAINFIFGAPLSGVRRLKHALNNHPDVCAAEFQLFGSYVEPKPIANRARNPGISFDQYAQTVADGFPLRQHELERREFIVSYLEEYLQFLVGFARKKTQKPILVDTVVPYPGTSRRIIDAIGSYFPDAKIIYLLRDGRDVATEATFESLALNGHGTDRYAFFVENRPNTRLRRFFDDHALNMWATNWSEAVAVQTRLDSNVLTVNYTDLEEEPQESLTQVLNHLGVVSELPKSLEGIKRGQLTERAATNHFKERFVHEGSIWPTFFTAEDGSLFDEIAGRQLRRTEFELDDEWVGKLPRKLDLSTS